MNVKAGDTVLRNLAGIPMKLRVTVVTAELIVCGPWTFDRATGIEIDDELDWGPKYGRSGSYIRELAP